MRSVVDLRGRKCQVVGKGRGDNEGGTISQLLSLLISSSPESIASATHSRKMGAEMFDPCKQLQAKSHDINGPNMVQSKLVRMQQEYRERGVDTGCLYYSCQSVKHRGVLGNVQSKDCSSVSSYTFSIESRSHSLLSEYVHLEVARPPSLLGSAILVTIRCLTSARIASEIVLTPSRFLVGLSFRGGCTSF